MREGVFMSPILAQGRTDKAVPCLFCVPFSIAAACDKVMKPAKTAPERISRTGITQQRKSPPMKFTPSRGKPPRLSDREEIALRGVADSTAVESLLCKRLKKLGLIEQTSGGWVLTQQGHIQLMFQGAR